MILSFTKACETFPRCYEAQFNRILLDWKLGKTFDEEVCNKIKQNVKDKHIAQMMVLTFRKAIGLILKPDQEALVLKNAQQAKPHPVLDRLISKYIDVFDDNCDMG